MDSSFVDQSMGGVTRSIRALFNDSGDGDMPRVVAADTGLPAHGALPPRSDLTPPFKSLPRRRDKHRMQLSLARQVRAHLHQAFLEGETTLASDALLHGTAQRRAG